MVANVLSGEEFIVCYKGSSNKCFCCVFWVSWVLQYQSWENQLYEIIRQDDFIITDNYFHTLWVVLRLAKNRTKLSVFPWLSAESHYRDKTIVRTRRNKLTARDTSQDSSFFKKCIRKLRLQDLLWPVECPKPSKTTNKHPKPQTSILDRMLVFRKGFLSNLIHFS